MTADDFGAAAEVNDAVEQAHGGGVLRAASLMVAGAASTDAVAIAKRNPGLRVGLHLVLVEGRPVLPASVLPDLVHPGGAFRTDMAAMGADIFFRPRVRRQLAAEIAAQFKAFAATGLPLDHVNTHKHYHLHPTIAGMILAIGRDYGLRASRAPIEPRAVLNAIEPGSGGGAAAITEPWARLVRRRYRRAGVIMADQVFGLAWSGAMTTGRLAGIIRRLPAGLSEIYLHPASGGGFPGAAPGYRYRDELDALMSHEVADAARSGGVVLGGFADFLGG